MAKWISFEQQPRMEGRKTDTWQVLPVGSNIPLGEVKWFSNWRKYCYWPFSSTIYEQDCLRDIATFCENATEVHKSNREAERAR